MADMEATGSTAAISHPAPEGDACMMTLQGSMTPTLSSISRASKAALGLQAPRMI